MTVQYHTKVVERETHLMNGRAVDEVEYQEHKIVVNNQPYNPAMLIEAATSWIVYAKKHKWMLKDGQGQTINFHRQINIWLTKIGENK